MKSYLIFRSDKIGDFLTTAILIKSIKRNEPQSKITLVSSENNYDYIKTFDYVDDVFVLKNSFFSKIKLILKLRKILFNSIIVADCKKRSIFVSFFLKSQNKILPSLLKESVFVNYLFDKIFYTNTNDTYIQNIKNVINHLNFTFHETDLNILSEKQAINNKKLFDNYSILHFDEKWIYKTYIKNYTNIEPNLNDFVTFIDKLQKKTNEYLVITTGKNPPEIFNYASNLNRNNKISFLPSNDFLQLEKIILHSNLLISCHGSVSHLASAVEIKQIDIIENPSIYSYDKWTSHFRLYKSIYRSNFKDLSANILNLV
tara:strand:+ start:1269 stop:2213 length:945 start_codon:yes stop_codon:yes gene_type:complete